MSSTANPGSGGGAGTGAGTQLYFCYQCNRTVSITTPSSGELVCPNCNGGFLEEYENPNPNPNPNIPSSNPNFLNPFGDLSGIPLMFSSSTAAGGGGSSIGGNSIDPFGDFDFESLFGGSGIGIGARRSGGGGGGGPEAFNPISFLHDYLQNLRASGANIQLVIDDNPMDLGEGLFGGGGGGGGRGGGFGFGLPATLGDYVIGPGLEQLIQQLAENDPNRYGTPPAAKSAVEGLPTIKITKEMLESDNSQCAVCKDEFELAAEARQMPCKHIYHPDCILPWLELHNSCPVCRYELPTDDPDYENRSEGAQGGTGGTTSGNRSGFSIALGGSGGSGGGTQESAPSPRTAERRLRISVPWLFRGFGGSPAETSNNSGGNNNSGANSDNRGGPNSGNEPREPGLD